MRWNELLKWTFFAVSVSVKRSVYRFPEHHLCKYNLSLLFFFCTFQLLVPRYIRVICSEGSHVLQPFVPPPPHAVTAGDLRVSLEVSTLRPCGDRNRISTGDCFTAVQECDSAPAQWYHLLYVSVWLCQVWKDWCLVSVCVGSAILPGRVWTQMLYCTFVASCGCLGRRGSAEHEPLGFTENPPTLSGNIGFLTIYGHPADVEQGHEHHTNGGANAGPVI